MSQANTNALLPGHVTDHGDYTVSTYTKERPTTLGGYVGWRAGVSFTEPGRGPQTRLGANASLHDTGWYETEVAAEAAAGRWIEGQGKRAAE